jgi:serine/threonine protein kinase
VNPVDDPALQLEWVERLPELELAARWHVRQAGVSRVAWVMFEHWHLDNEAIERECLAWQGFTHPRASAIRHAGRYGGKLVVLVDDDRGPSLADATAHLRDTGIEHEGWLVAQLVTIADALDAMAKRRPGFLYRGLDPSRLFVDHTGRGRLRAPVGVLPRERPPNTMGAGVVMGAPHWMSPEQCLGHPLAPASNVFTLAALFVHAACGKPPFDAGDDDGPMMVLQKIIMEPPVLPAFHTPGLAKVVEHALSRDIQHRIPDPGAFAAELYACVPDAGDHDAVVSDRLAAWWPTAPQADGPMPADRSILCSKTWEELEPMERADMRFCGSCKQSVVQVRSLAAAIPLVGNSCIHFKPRNW